MKAIILNHECGCVEKVEIPKPIADQYTEEQDTEAVWLYLQALNGYNEFTPFMLVDDNCPIYDCSEDSDDIESPIYVIR